MTFPSALTGTPIADPSTVDWLAHHAADARRVADAGGDDRHHRADVMSALLYTRHCV